MKRASETIYKLARSRLDGIRDVWKEDHEAAMDCLDFEAFLQALLETFELLDVLFSQSHLQVFRGEVEPDLQWDQNERKIYHSWDSLTDEIARALNKYESQYEVKGATKFRRCQEVVKERLANWAPARPSKAIGFRVDELDEEDAADLRRVVEVGAKSGEGRTTLAPVTIPQGDPSLLLNRCKLSAR